MIYFRTLSDLLELKSSRAPGEAIIDADRLECMLFSEHDPYFDGHEPPRLMRLKEAGFRGNNTSDENIIGQLLPETDASRKRHIKRHFEWQSSIRQFSTSVYCEDNSIFS